MLLLVTILLIGVLFGFGLGGSPSNVADARLRWWWLIPAALALQLLPIPLGESGLPRLLPVGVLLLSYALLIVTASLNWRLRGFLLILVGLTLNFTVIGLNHGMPVARDALQRAGNPELLEELPAQRGGKHHVARDRDVLLPLADVIAFRQPFGVVVSAGDLAIDSGGAIFLAAAMLGRPERNPRRMPHPRTAGPAATSGTRR